MVIFCEPQKQQKITQDRCFICQNMTRVSASAEVHNLSQSKLTLQQLCLPGALLSCAPILPLCFIPGRCAGSDTQLVLLALKTRILPPSLLFPSSGPSTSALDGVTWAVLGQCSVPRGCVAQHQPSLPAQQNLPQLWSL